MGIISKYFRTAYPIPSLRIGYTIILNGLHHLTHHDYAEYLASHLDYWIIIEGANDNQGSTSWCKPMQQTYHNNGASIDGTVPFLEDLEKKYNSVICKYANGVWESKDAKINAAIEVVKSLTQSCFLWEIDCDEQWTIKQMEYAEKELILKRGKTGLFYCDFFVGKDLLAKGDWGEGYACPYRRLWNWAGEYYQAHEPPLLEGGNGKEVLLNPRFRHYAYYFEKDVAFKNEWYGDHEGILDRWKLLQRETQFPQNITKLLSNTGKWGKTNTLIVKESPQPTVPPFQT